jgi:PrcB C-terminal
MATAIRSKEQWQHFWTRHAISEPPTMDFSRDMVIAVFMGEQRSHGSAIEIQRVEYKSVLLKVLSQVVKPPSDTTTLQVPTQPYHIIKLQKMDLPVCVNRRLSSG